MVPFRLASFLEYMNQKEENINYTSQREKLIQYYLTVLLTGCMLLMQQKQANPNMTKMPRINMVTELGVIQLVTGAVGEAVGVGTFRNLKVLSTV